MKGIILAAGPGIELSPLTYNMPKPMLKILGKPLLEYSLLRFKENGFTDIIIVIREEQLSIREHFGNGKQLGINIEYCYQKADLPGISGALRSIKDRLAKEDKFIVSHADIICDPSILSRTMNAAEAAGTDISIGVTLQSDIRD